MSESGDQFAGTAARSTKHSPRVDEELEHEIQGMLKAERSTRAEEWREVEPQAEGDPDIDSSPAGTLVGGVPKGMTEDAVVDELRRLPEGETYERIGDVVRALGYPTET